MIRQLKEKIHTGVLSVMAITVPVFLMLGCSDDLLPGTEVNEESDMQGVDAYLSLTVSDFSISMGSRAEEPSETEEPVSEDENRIDNIWVFQYNTSGDQIRDPEYIEITDQSKLSRLNLKLAGGEETYICVVANTGDKEWGKSTDLKTHEGLKNKAMSNPEPILLSEFKPIPMEGSVKATVINGSVIIVPIRRMFAKLRISFGDLANGMTPKSIEINNIPNYCRVHTLGDGLSDEQAATYGADTDWITRSFNASDSSEEDVATNGREYVIYVPENLQGEKYQDESHDKNAIAPRNALVINMTMRYNFEEPLPGSGHEGYTVKLEEDRHYTVYPGGNTRNNFNIKRNHVYRVKVNVYNPQQYTPSSNCFVVEPGRSIAFEPYYRTETGGDYNFRDYLDPEDESGEKVIKKVGIIWQTKEAIGNNSAGDKVWFAENDENPSKPEHSRIIVRTNKEGNALVGAYNSKGEIIWSWHIWITGNDPGNVGKAIVYDTYTWDNSGIKTNTREPGYAVMPCNLGALANSPEDTGNANTPDSWYCKNFRTYGTLYQWGRKDPFPPSKKKNKDVSFYYYNDLNYGINTNDGLGSNIEVFDNSHLKITTTKNDSQESEIRFGSLFDTISATDGKLGTNSKSGIKYSINNPTTHIAAGINVTGTAYNSSSSYFNRGDWLPVEDEKLWGAIPRAEAMESLVIVQNKSSICRNYGPQKTIFDPCPTGWRVPPGDLWLGFTTDGKNKQCGTLFSSDEELWNNCNVLISKNKSYYNNNNGYWLCLKGWHSSDETKYSFFPTQGSRIASGQPWQGGICGNYHNATSDKPWTLTGSDGKLLDRVNIFHLHSMDNSFAIYTFEESAVYTTKAVAGPIRCVRDTK